MDTLTKTLLSQLAAGGMAAIGEQVGVDGQGAETALATIMPILVSTLAVNASKPAGAKALHSALAEDHDGSILGDLPGYLQDPKSADGEGILGHALGDKRPAVEQGLAAQTGLDGRQIGQLLQIAAPLVMGALGAQQRSKGLDASGLAKMLGSQASANRKESGDLLGALNTALDSNRDGSAVDEVLGFVEKLAHSAGAARQAKTAKSATSARPTPKVPTKKPMA